MFVSISGLGFTVKVTLSDETPTLRQTWDGEKYNLILVHTEESIDMERSEILPIYWNHNDNSLPIGSYENVRLENNKLEADAVFDENDAFAMTVFNKIKSKHIKTLSVGATILSKTVTEEEDGTYTVRATRWQPFEGSFTGNPANPNARVSLSNSSEGDAINLKNEGEEVDLKKTLEFLSNATAEDKEQIKKALGTDVEAVTLSNQITDLKVELTAAKSNDVLLAKTNESIKNIFEMITSETFANISADKKKEAIASVKLSNEGDFNKMEFENILLKQAIGSKPPVSGEQNQNNGDAFENQNNEMAGKL